MSTRRLSTVHDLASLRLHPDGTRVQNHDKNLRIRASKYTARDSKGNWFARDAGGTGRVKQRFAKSRGEDTEEEGSTEAEEGVRAKSKGKQRAESESEGETEFNDYRARKRRRYLADDSFIAPTTSGAPSTQGSPNASSSRLPSEGAHAISDLPTPNAETLKCMHYFACNYYTAMGQLRDSTKELRLSRKARQRRKLQACEDGEKAVVSADKPSGNESSTEEESSSSSSSDSENDVEGGERSEVAYRQQTRRRRERRASPDMYKAFDGSALMAISMLVQEHIVSLLNEDVPEEWDEEMLAEEETQRSRQAALRSLRSSRQSRSSLRARPEYTVGDHEDDAEEQPEKEAETPGRRTRGVVPKITVPLADDSSEDEDYVP